MTRQQRRKTASAEIVKFDKGRHWRGKLGFVLLAMEQTIEDDVLRLAPRGVGIHFTRIKMPNQVTVNNLKATSSELAQAAALILPDSPPDVICFACTSASFILGEDLVRKELSKGSPKAVSTTLVTGVVQALRALNVHKLVIATPYLEDINLLEKDYFQRQGFKILELKGMNLRDDSDIARVRPEYIKDFALSLDHPQADAIFISCGALRSLDIVDKLEQKAGKYVVVSNQAMIWETLRLAGIEDKIKGYGRLFSEH